MSVLTITAQLLPHACINMASMCPSVNLLLKMGTSLLRNARKQLHGLKLEGLQRIHKVNKVIIGPSASSAN